ncbi:MAG TPA: hypothetical protein VLH08_09525, partial [Acidobacteriota bacterium]|nr:hypothetical protein [Acidobacteriota bacterium]
MKKKLYFVFFCLIQIFGPVTILSAQSRWGRTIEGANNTPLVRQTTDNGFIVGTTSGTFGLQNAWLVKLNSTGAIQWQKAYGNGGTCSTAHALQQTTDNGFVFAGHLDTACPSEANFWVVKVDSTGAIQWQKSYGGTSTEVAYAITQTSDQGYLVGGSTSSFGAFPGDYHIWLLKLDSNGNIQWQKAIGGNEDEEAKSVQQTSDGGYIVTGFTVSFGVGDEDFFVLKLDSSGNVVW